jgi:ankyrin repeat protein
LKDCLDYPRLRQALRTLPKTLDITYARILEDIPDGHLAQATTILSLLIWSDWPLSINQLVDAVAVNLNEDPAFDPKNRMPVPRDILKLCSSLIAVYETQPGQDSVQLAHFSVKEYLVSRHVSMVFKALLDEPVAKAYLARLCLRYLVGVSRIILEDPQVSANTGQAVRRVFPLAQYSACAWMVLAREADSEDEGLFNTVVDFFTNEHQAFRLFREIQTVWLPHDTTALCYAVIYCSKRIIISLLDCGADINVDEGETLEAAVARGSTDIIQLLLDRGADVHAGDSRALLRGSSLGNAKAVELLLDHGADVNARDGLALIEAVYNGRDTTVQLLLSRGADINARSGQVLSIASRQGRDKIVQLLLDGGVERNAGGGQALFDVSNSNRDTTMQLSLDGTVKEGAETNKALSVALRHGYNSTVQLPPDGGANVNAKYGEALRVASQEGHASTVQLLIDRGADVNAGNGDALRAASGRKAILRLLLDNGADINADDGGALRNAARSGNARIVRLLLDLGADVNAGDGGPLRAAVGRGEETVVQLLLDRGANPNACSHSRGTALQEAMRRYYRTFVEHLKLSGSRATALDADRMKQYTKTLRLLLEKGADRNVLGGEWFETLAEDVWSVETVKGILERDHFLSVDHILSALLDTDPRAEAIVSVILPYITPRIAARKQNWLQRRLPHYAAICGSETVAQRCLDLGIDVDAQDREGRTALHYAAYHGCLTIVKMLVQAGSDTEILDEYCRKPLTYAQEGIPMHVSRHMNLRRSQSPQTDIQGVIKYLSNRTQEEVPETSL